MKALTGLLIAFLGLSVVWAAPAPQPARPTDRQCLASAIHYESGGEALEGKRAVYEVIKNRAREAKASICTVVTAPGQFSWMGLKPILPYTDDMKAMVRKVRQHPAVLSSEKWFFTTRIKTPKWARQLECRVIGNHKFCKAKEKEDAIRQGNNYPGVPAIERWEAGLDSGRLPVDAGSQ